MRITSSACSRNAELTIPAVLQEFLLFLLPLVNLHRLRLRLSKAVSSRASKSTTLRTLASALPAPLAAPLGLSSLRASSNNSAKRSGASPADDKPHGPLAFLAPDVCPICHSRSHAPPSHLPSASFADPTLPSASLLHTSSSSSGDAAGDARVKVAYVADCRFGCRYCYYCIVGALVKADDEAEEAWTCLRCGEAVHGARREVVEALVRDGGDEAEGGESGDEGEKREQ